MATQVIDPLQALLTLAYLLVVTASGACVLRLLPLGSKEEKPAEYWVPVSFCFGLGFQAIVFILSLLVFRSVSFWVFLAALMGLAVATWATWKDGPGVRLGKLAMLDGPGDKSLRVLYWLPIAVSLLLIAALMYQSLVYPMNLFYDGRSIWFYKAKLLFHEGTIFSEAFLDPYRVHYHRDYPLMMPLASYNLYNFLGGENEAYVRFINITFLAMFMLYVFHWCRRRLTPMHASFIAFLFVAYPFSWYWARGGIGITNGDADFPLSFFALVSAMSFYEYWRTRSKYELLIGAIMAGLCLMTKKEGIIAFAVLMGANGLKALFTERALWLRSMGSTAIAGALAIGVALPSLLLGSMMPNLYDEKFFDMIRPENFDFVEQRYPIIFTEFLKDVYRVDKWSFFWYFYLIALPLSIKSWVLKKDYFLDSMIVAWLFAVTFVYIFTPLNLVFHVTTSMGRLLGHVFPIVFFRLIIFYSEWRELALADKPAPEGAA